MESNDDFICPVTLDKFKNPQVLPCGHTFDKEVIKKLKRNICPLCKKAFMSRECVPNWILIKHLNLDINENKSNNIKSFNANDAKNEMNIIETGEKVDKIIDKIIKKIRKRSILGKSYCIYLYNKFTITPRIIKSICHELNNRHFYTGNWHDIFWYGQLYISWHILPTR